MSCVHSRMGCDHSRTGCVHSTHARRRWRLHCAFTAHLLRNVCSAIARRFFWTCSKFDGARSLCLAHLGDSTAYVWRTQSVNEDPRAHVACQRSSIAGQWNRGISKKGYWSISTEHNAIPTWCLISFNTKLFCLQQHNLHIRLHWISIFYILHLPIPDIFI